jgi:hypothetical protein
MLVSPKISYFTYISLSMIIRLQTKGILALKDEMARVHIYTHTLTSFAKMHYIPPVL